MALFNSGAAITANGTYTAKLQGGNEFQLTIGGTWGAASVTPQILDEAGNAIGLDTAQTANYVKNVRCPSGFTVQFVVTGITTGTSLMATWQIVTRDGRY